jgi:hypothetical protein
MSTDPDQIRDQVAELLSGLPDLSSDSAGPHDVDHTVVDDLVRRLEQAHDVLVAALESVEKD